MMTSKLRGFWQTLRPSACHYTSPSHTKSKEVCRGQVGNLKPVFCFLNWAKIYICQEQHKSNFLESNSHSSHTPAVYYVFFDSMILYLAVLQDTLQ